MSDQEKRQSFREEMAVAERLGDELAAAEQIVYDPVWWQATQDNTIPPAVARLMGELTGAGPDSYTITVPNPFRLDGQEGKVAVTVRPDEFHGEPALVVTTVDIVEGHDQSPGQWWTSFGISLYERGWTYDADHVDTGDWRIELTPGPDSSAPVTVAITDPRGEHLFHGPALLPPVWLVRARHARQGVFVIAGQVSGSRVPRCLAAANVEAMLDTGDLVVARIPVTVHAPATAVAG